MNKPTWRRNGGAERLPQVQGESRPARGAAQYIRLDAVLAMVPMSPSTVWRKVRDGSFVQPVKLSARITAWNREAVEAWIAEREAS